MTIAPDYIGQKLINRPFRDWFLYMFKVIEGRRFIVEPLHSEMFEWFEDIFKGKHPRSNISLPPRSGKTTLCQYILIKILWSKFHSIF